MQARSTLAATSNDIDSSCNTVISDNGLIAGGFHVAGVERGFIVTCSGNGC